MKYFAILYVTYTDETPTKKAIYDAQSSDEAVAMVHRYVGQYMCGTNVSTVLVIASDNYGTIYKNEHWHTSVSE